MGWARVGRQPMRCPPPGRSTCKGHGARVRGRFRRKWVSAFESSISPDGLELIGKVLAAGVGGVEVRLDHHGEATADHTIALAPAQRRLHARRTFVGHTLCENTKGTASIGMKRVWYTVMVQASRLRTHQPHVEANLVPFDHRAGDLEVRETNRGLPRLGRVEDQIVEGVADLCTRKRNTRSAMRVCVKRVQRLCALVFWPTYASGK